MSLLECKQAARQRSLRTGLDGEETRRQREDEAVQLRKNKRVEALAKKRMVCQEAPPTPVANQENVPAAAATNGVKTKDDGPDPVISQLPQLAAAILGSVRDPAFKAARDVRKLLSAADDPPIKEVVALQGVLPRLVQFLGDDTDHGLQFEAAWALTNIASGDSEDTLLVASLGTIPLFTRLLASPSDDVKEQAVWALANMAGENAQLRDEVVDVSLPSIMQLIEAVGKEIYIEHRDKFNVLGNATWAFSNAFRGTPPVATERVRNGLPMLAGLMQVDHKDVSTDAAWGASYFTSKAGKERLQAAVEAGLPAAAVKMLAAKTLKQVQPALRVAGNMVAGDDTIADAMIRAGLLDAIPGLLRHTNKAICKETAWMVSNIAGGTPDQVVALCNANILPLIVELASSPRDEVRREVVYVLSNISRAGADFLPVLANAGAVQALCQLLELKDSELVHQALLTLRVLLEWADGEGNLAAIASVVERAGGVSTLEELQDSDNDKVYEEALDIVEKFFGGVDAETTQNACTPAATTANPTFNFA